VSHVESLEEIYLQLGKNSADLEMLLDRLDEVYSIAQAGADDCEPVSLTPGQPVCVNHTNVWYRAEVLKINEDSSTVVVRFVDYGKVETVPRVSIRQLNAEFVSFCPFAFQCRLYGVENITGTYDH
jgi:Tudor domain